MIPKHHVVAMLYVLPYALLAALIIDHPIAGKIMAATFLWSTGVAGLMAIMAWDEKAREQARSLFDDAATWLAARRPRFSR